MFSSVKIYNLKILLLCVVQHSVFHRDAGLVLMPLNWNKHLADPILKSLDPFPCTQWLFLLCFLSLSTSQPLALREAERLFITVSKVVFEVLDILTYAKMTSFVNKGDFYAILLWSCLILPLGCLTYHSCF